MVKMVLATFNGLWKARQVKKKEERERPTMMEGEEKTAKKTLQAWKALLQSYNNQPQFP
jgi:hypothetical protein